MSKNDGTAHVVDFHAGENETLRELVGELGAHLRAISAHFGVAITQRGTRLRVVGSVDSVEQTVSLLVQLDEIAGRGNPLSSRDIQTALRVITQDSEARLEPFLCGSNGANHRRRQVRPRSLGQQRYIEAIERETVVFGVGPAGTGKTFLAVAMAVDALRAGRVKQILLTRPAVEAGEKLGFLPGDISEKVDPYLRPLWDALTELLSAEKVEQLLEQGVIEVAPLAFMRGRTLSDAFVILDEAQNTTAAQMRMFLTRLGENSTMVVNGDITQIDLQAGRTCGLKDALLALDGLRSVAVVRFSTDDVVRHPLVAQIIRAYERSDRTRATR